MTPFNFGNFIPQYFTMQEGIFETAKSIQNLANVISAMIFFKHFWDNNDAASLFSGIIVLSNFYMLSFAMFMISAELKEKK